MAQRGGEGGTGCGWHSRVDKKRYCIQVVVGCFCTGDLNKGGASPTHLCHPVRIFDGAASQTTQLF